MIVPRPQDLLLTEAVILCFSKIMEDQGAQDYLGIFLAASTTSRVGLRCRILETIRPDESLRADFAREQSLYLKDTTDRSDTEADIKWLDKYEYKGGLNKVLAAKYDLNPLHHQVVAKDHQSSCTARVSLSLQNISNRQLVAPVEITFIDYSQ